jgi:hypothetical protein
MGFGNRFEYPTLAESSLFLNLLLNMLATGFHVAVSMNLDSFRLFLIPDAIHLPERSEGHLVYEKRKRKRLYIYTAGLPAIGW